eukprot:Gb_37517 [translate_table: standard]
MICAVANMELTPPLSPPPFCANNSKFTNHKRIHMPIFYNVEIVDGLIHDATPMAAAVKGQPAKISRKESQGNFLDKKDTQDHATLLQACTSIKELKQVHAHMLRSGIVRNIFLETKLVSLYCNCGSIENARLVFDKMSKRNAFLWNVVIRGYAKNGLSEEALKLYYRMQQEGVQPDKFTFPSLLKACASLSAIEKGKEIHDDIIRIGVDSDVFVRNALIAMYGKCGRVDIARQLFDEMSEINVVSWNTMIAGYVQNRHANDALTLFNEMQLADIQPDLVTITSVLSACAHLADLQQGKWIHDFLMRSGFDSNVFVTTALIDMYTKCGNMEIARQLFDKMPKRNVVSWNAMIAGYAQNGHANEAWKLFHQMQLAEEIPDSVTMVSVLQACAHLGVLEQGKRVHDYVIRRGFQSDVYVGNSLVAMYAKCGSINIARQLFDNMSKRNVVSWNAMIFGYAENGHAHEALRLFYQMQMADVTPDLATILSVLSGCSHLAALRQGERIHGFIIRSGFESDTFVGNSLIDMYGKCGSIEIARQFFDKMAERDVVSWNAMIAGYGMHGCGENVLTLFFQMKQTGIKPDDITFISVLSACSHAGLVNEGCQYFYYMNQHYCITPSVEHYACMVDLLGRAGRLDEAQDFIEKMPLEPSASVWGALLSACRIYCNMELGERVAERLFELEPENPGYYVLLSNIYATAGRWNDVANVRTMMKDKGVKKQPGCSMIEVNNRVHAFLVGDKSHPQSEKIYGMLETLSGQMEQAGYLPNTDFVLHDVEDEMKEHVLYSHSEKLAIAFGLISTSPGTPIRITKNLRVCADCHSAIKFISKIVKREIIVRDVNRFHHFNGGLCSCGDYW